MFVGFSIRPVAVHILNVSEVVLKITRWAPLLVVYLLLPSLPVDVLAAKLFDKSAKKQLTAYLDEICQWIMATDGAMGKSAKEADSSFAVSGNLARVLVAGFELTKNNSKYLELALSWCDAFTSEQQRVETSRGNEGGYWWNRATKGNIDLGDTSMALTALARVSVYAESRRKQNYLQAMERYARFVMEGCKQDPQRKNRGDSRGWIILDGKDKGAIGGGYYPDHVSDKPSTVATAAGSAFFAQIYAITKNKQYREIAVNAVSWILRTRKAIGEIPDVQDGQESDQLPLSTVTWCAEGLLAAFHLLQDPGLDQQMAKEVEPTIRWLIRIQNDRGLWGEGPDQQRSSGAATLLAWFYLNVTADEVIPQTLEKFWQVLLNPVHSQSFGVQMQNLPTGLAGLTTAEMIKPGITFKKI